MVGTIVLGVLWVLSVWAFNSFAKRTSAEIDQLKRENLRLAQTAIKHKERLERLEALPVQKELTPEQPKRKIEARPRRMTWRGTLAAVENAYDKAEEQ